MGKRKRVDDPIADYIEWTQHRYDPGYYLGGNLPPHLRKASLGPKGRRFAGILLGVMALMTLASALGMSAFELPILEVIAYAAVVMLIAAAAVKMYRAGREHAGGSKSA
jgi:hypothetical protein